MAGTESVLIEIVLRKNFYEDETNSFWYIFALAIIDIIREGAGRMVGDKSAAGANYNNC